MTFHGSDVLGSVAANGRYTLLGGALTRVSAIVAKYADTAIIVAEHFKKFLPRREYHVLPTGVDLEKFRPLGMKLARSRLGMKLDVPIILFGAPPSTAVKRFALAREVWKRVRAKHVNCELLCLDKVPHSVVPLYINAADCLLLTSFHEGSPTIVKEALACNVPIVSVDVGDVRCRVKGLKECFVSESLDPEALARAVIASFRARPTFEGRHAVVDLDLPRIAERLLSIYESSLRKAAERSGGTRASVHVER
jgi:glycosyltransferase involved in cell wall biosynthesis